MDREKLREIVNLYLDKKFDEEWMSAPLIKDADLKNLYRMYKYFKEEECEEYALQEVQMQIDKMYNLETKDFDTLFIISKS